MLVDCLDWNAERQDIVSVMKREESPLIIWGKGQVASCVQEYLEQNDIAISCFCVDGCEAEQQYLGLPVLNWQMVQERYPRFNVVLGHSQYQKGELLRKRLGQQVNQVFYVHSPIYDTSFFDKEGIKRDLERYQAVFDKLADEKSRRSMAAFLNTGMTGDAKYIFSEFDHHLEIFQNDIFHIGKSESYWDVGAFIGDTVRQFRKANNNQYKLIVAIEPDQYSFSELKEYVDSEKIDRITVVQSGVWETSGKMLFRAGKQQKSAIISENESGSGEVGCVEVNVMSLDDIAVQMNVKEATLLKFNYYPYVAQGVKGAEQLIQNNKPRIIARIGFDRMSLVDVVNEIMSIEEDYKIYLRFNDAMMSALLLYAIYGETESK